MSWIDSDPKIHRAFMDHCAAQHKDTAMRITKATHPAVHAAMLAVEIDNGAHLLGTVYPGAPVDLEGFMIPDTHAHLLPAAEAGLARLKADSEQDFNNFCCGDVADSDEIERRRGDLTEAGKLLNDWFDDWQ